MNQNDETISESKARFEIDGDGNIKLFHRDGHQVFPYQGDMECLVCGSTEPHAAHNIVRTVVPEEKIS